MSDTFRTIVMVVSHTPPWVWVHYGLLLFLGLQRYYIQGLLVGSVKG